MRILFFTIICLVLSTVVYCQTFRYGAELGLGISRPRYSSFSNSKLCMCDNLSNTDFSVVPAGSINGYIELKNHEMWGLSSEPGLIIKSGYKHYESTFSDYEEKMYMLSYYFQTPIMFNYYVKKLSFSVGPEVAFALYTGIFANENVRKNYLRQGRSLFELSSGIGLGYMLIEHFQIVLKYNHGITDIQPIVKSHFGNLYNQYVMIQFRYFK